jgi:hypothetical protein
MLKITLTSLLWEGINPVPADVLHKDMFLRCNLELQICRRRKGSV